MKWILATLVLAIFMIGAVSNAFAQDTKPPSKETVSAPHAKRTASEKSRKARVSRKSVKAKIISHKAHGTKGFEGMTASQVAKNPAAYGFTKGGAMVITPVNGSSLPPSRDEQWTKEANGRVYILTIHYDRNHKMVYAKWGGF